MSKGKEFFRQCGKTLHFIALLWSVVALGLVIQFGSRLTVRLNYLNAAVSYADEDDQLPVKVARAK